MIGGWSICSFMVLRISFVKIPLVADRPATANFVASRKNSVFRFRIQEGKNDPKNRKKLRKFMFRSVGCSLLRAEGFSRDKYHYVP
jgi:hypothetical protein